MADKEIEIVTSKQIMAIAEIPNGSEKQAQINKIIIAFADKKARFESPDIWSEYFEVIHKHTSLSHGMKKRAFFNAYDCQAQLLSELNYGGRGQR